MHAPPDAPVRSPRPRRRARVTRGRAWRSPALWLLAGGVASASVSLWAILSARSFRANITLNARQAVTQRVADDQPGQGENGWGTLMEAAAVWEQVADSVSDHADRMSELKLLYPGQAEPHYYGRDLDALLKPPVAMPSGPRPQDEAYPTSPPGGLTLYERMEAERLAREHYVQQALARLTIHAAERTTLDALLDEVAASPRLVRIMEGDGPLVGVLLPELSSMRQIAKMERARMRLAWSGGRIDEALRAFEHMLALGRAGAAQGTLIDRLVAVAIYELALEELDAWLTDAPPDAPTLMRLGSIVDRQAYVGPHSTWIATERLFAEDVIQRVYTDDGQGGGMFLMAEYEWLDDMMVPDSGVDLDSRWLNALGAFFPSRRQTSEAFEVMYRDVEATITPLSGAQAVAPPSPQAVARAQQNPLVRMLAPAIIRGAGKIDDTAQHIRLARVTLALEACYARHGAYPQTLDELAPEFLEAVPPDPLTGRPLAYTPPVDGAHTRRGYVIAAPSPFPEPAADPAPASP